MSRIISSPIIPTPFFRRWAGEGSSGVFENPDNLEDFEDFEDFEDLEDLEDPLHQSLEHERDYVAGVADDMVGVSLLEI